MSCHASEFQSMHESARAVLGSAPSNALGIMQPSEEDAGFKAARAHRLGALFCVLHTLLNLLVDVILDRLEGVLSEDALIQAVLFELGNGVPCLRSHSELLRQWV